MMINTGWLNVGSLILGLIAWGAPILSLIQYKKASIGRYSLYAIISFGACVTSLYMQILYTGHLVQISDWTALLDTYGAVISASSILLVVTVLINLIALVLYLRKK